MDQIRLGNTDLMVSRLCYGTEPFTTKKGPRGMMSQGDIGPEKGGSVLREALEIGVNFWDTSDDYGTHPHVRAGLGLVDREKVVVADKTFAQEYEEGREAIKSALRDLGTNYIDLMLLHLVPLKSFTWDIAGKEVAVGDLESRAGALQAFVDAKEKGEIRAVGLSSHSAIVLEKALKMPEIEVVCTTFNKVGSFVEDGSQEAHLEAIKSAKAAGKGVYVVKVINAGKLRDEAPSAIRYALQFHEFIDAWNIGMYDMDDVTQNVKLFKEVLG